MLEAGARPSTDPSRIGRYEIRRERGRGAMGVVYEAHDPALGRPVALKTIRLPFTATAEDLEAFEKRFFAEARVAACLSHPGIVTVHDVARDPETGTLYMALEYLEGRTLAEIIRGGVAMSTSEALRITARIATALHHAHSNGVVHRDIKPSNIMILGNGEPKIMDFGIAKAEGALGRLTVAGRVLGTPLYMSPEQVLGHGVDARSDVFSLGAIAYSLLTGHHAFAAETIVKVVARVIEDDPSPPSTLVPGLPCDVNYIVQRAMAKEPTERYPVASMIAEDIQDVLACRPLRHREGNATPQADLDTLFSRRGAPPLLDPLPSATSAGVSASDLLTAASETNAPDSTVALPATSRGQARVSLAAASGSAFLVAMALASGAFWLTYPDPGASAAPPAPADAPSPVSESPVPREGAPFREDGLATPEPAAPTVPRARLAIDFEHPLKSGTIRVWLGTTLIVDEALDGRVTRRLVAFKVRKGTFQEVVEVSPGRYTVTVEVKWDETRRLERISGNLRVGSPTHLKIRIGRLRKDLSVDWETPARPETRSSSGAP